MTTITNSIAFLVSCLVALYLTTAAAQAPVPQRTPAPSQQRPPAPVPPHVAPDQPISPPTMRFPTKPLPSVLLIGPSAAGELSKYDSGLADEAYTHVMAKDSNALEARQLSQRGYEYLIRNYYGAAAYMFDRALFVCNASNQQYIDRFCNPEMVLITTYLTVKAHLADNDTTRAAASCKYLNDTFPKLLTEYREASAFAISDACKGIGK